MKFFSRLSLTICILCISLFSSLALAANKTQDVHFQKGATSAEYPAKIKGYDFNDYVFYAKKGQALTAKLLTKSTKLWINLSNKHLESGVDLSEYSEALNKQGAYILPYSGKYTIRVGQYRAFARRGEHSDFTLLIEIK
ncbi:MULTISPECIES: hypothetical protein [unclassified Photobacterium]|uniref:hypothetical protein n=1 Tax=unclassified Photobacterium TaxID=2628852 RepID=UPI000D17AD74|nr:MULTISPECIES: hypothetical protein [unclassified Photobacterium]PSV28277.1 hypothetical protein C9J42_03715 [Photobacterium sp. GB-56]PSV32541.1 hypothetical protein C9J40_05070 [Photobacterium sp. GB-72]PSV38758.1 hypothetical protein C9J44_02865 [Photobacterium sp. GB-27]PSV40064.1 hypothetical protein C9J38_05975 [Photobacterium sp. GB-210]PSV47203.1 hypothetical protein C9J46_02925 [Photobacterium sp. GB-36]